MLTGLIARQAEMQFAYEDRIADLRAQIDRMSSRQLLDQEQYEQKLDQIVRRQAALESRANAASADAGLTGRSPDRRRPTGASRRAPCAKQAIDRSVTSLEPVRPTRADARPQRQ